MRRILKSPILWLFILFSHSACAHSHLPMNRATPAGNTEVEGAYVRVHNDSHHTISVYVDDDWLGYVAAGDTETFGVRPGERHFSALAEGRSGVTTHRNMRAGKTFKWRIAD